MNPTAIYSKSGKGGEEATGNTRPLKRPDRAVLSAIDGRATLADVAQKCGKTFDAGFQGLITQLDKDGFIRAVSAGAAPPAAREGGFHPRRVGGCAPGGAGARASQGATGQARRQADGTDGRGLRPR